MSSQSNLSLRQIVGKGYDELFWNLSSDEKKREWAKSRRYFIYKGSRASKKSYSVSFWILLNMMLPEYKNANTIVVRKVADTIYGSCYARLEKCMYMLGVRDQWICRKSPMEMEYKPTGQKIIFRGADDSMKISSIDVTHGVLCWAWFEETYEIRTEQDFDIIDQAIRGEMPDGLFIRIICSFNPWNRHHWLRTKFFEKEDGTPLNDSLTFATTTNYLMNEWLTDQDRAYYERMKVQNPKMYRVAGLGEWGSPEGVIYDNWEELKFDYNEVAQREGAVSICGLDFGFSADPTAMTCMIVIPSKYEIYIYDELYDKGLTSRKRATRIKEMGHAKSTIIYDSANPLDATELAEEGIENLIPAPKTKNGETRLNGINRVRDYQIFVHPRCVNHIIEFENYMWFVDKDGRTLPKPSPLSLDHLMDAVRYALMGVVLLGYGGFIGEVTDGSQDDIKARYQYALESETEDKDDDYGYCYST